MAAGEGGINAQVSVWVSGRGSFITQESKKVANRNGLLKLFLSHIISNLTYNLNGFIVQNMCSL